MLTIVGKKGPSGSSDRMPSIKLIATIAIVSALTMAVINRQAKLKSLVAGSAA